MFISKNSQAVLFAYRDVLQSHGPERCVSQAVAKSPVFYIEVVKFSVHTLLEIYFNLTSSPPNKGNKLVEKSK